MTPKRASDNQRRASNPRTSAWVSASAGSGKTYVLVDRVIRLMLAGAEPGKVLCLTFTKAAAAEMQNRLFERLGAWTGLDDEALADAISGLGAGKPDADTLRRARKLFALALETPGGLKIQTIHAFCERLLQLFPVEAGVAPGFSVMDDISARGLLAEARARILAVAAADPDSAEGGALALVSSRTNEDSFDTLMSAVLDARDKLGDRLTGSQARDRAMADLARHMALDLGDTPQTVEAAYRDIPAGDFKRAAEALRAHGGKTSGEFAAKLDEAVRRCASGVPLRDHLVAAMFTKKLEPASRKNIVTKGVLGFAPWVADAIASEQQRLDRLLDKEAALEIVAATRALMTLASGIVDTYETGKRDAGSYDFSDLIARARALLTRAGAAQWVLYKLDGGIDHVLIDEAQDTSPAQWDIARALTTEFFAGEGARAEARRTVFAVGDRKQSIFSFQGADADAFDAARDDFGRRIGGAGQTLESVGLAVSYRSGRTVLDAVNAVFASQSASPGVASPQSPFDPHEPVRKGMAGRVTLWPLVEADEAETPGPFDPPRRREPADHPRRKLARRIAITVKSWIADRRMLEARGRPVTEGDILILVRTRDLLFEALVPELRRRGIKVAGADRLKLAEHIAVQDLISLARFVLMPEDDLSLAELLKSPLCESEETRCLTEDELFGLAHDRGNATLWDGLKSAPKHAPLARLIADYRASARRETPFVFFSAVAGARRAAIEARLGPDSIDPLEAFVTKALDFERQAAPTLSGFLDWFERGGAEIKRNMDRARDEVRIMTVHAAKGLEANIVIVADAVGLPGENSREPFLVAETQDGPLPVWLLSGMPRLPPAVQDWKRRRAERAMDEYRRLLYVAMTRACDELYIGGAKMKSGAKPECWYNLAGEALNAHDRLILDKESLVLESPQTAEPDGAAADAAAGETPPLPPWIGEAPGAAEELQPRAVASAPAHGSPEERLRGRVLHRLFQILPARAPAERLALARRLLARDKLDPSLAEDVAGLMEHPDYRAYFAPEARAEVPLAGTLADGRRISGRIDRLIVRDECVLVLDFKTGAPPDDGPGPGIRTQLARYRAVLGQIYPGRPVRSAVLWTAVPRLDEVA